MKRIAILAFTCYAVEINPEKEQIITGEGAYCGLFTGFSGIAGLNLLFF